MSTINPDRFHGGLENLDGSFTAGSALSAGDAVTISGEHEVDHVSSNGDPAIGVVMYDVSENDPVTVARDGAKVVVNADETDTPDAGDRVSAQTDGEVEEAEDDESILGMLETDEDDGEAVIMIATGGDESSA